MVIAPNPELEMSQPTIPALNNEELMRRNQAAIALLDAWEKDGDEQDQQETMRVIREALGGRRTESPLTLLR